MKSVLACVFLAAFLATLWLIWPAPAADSRTWARAGRRTGAAGASASSADGAGEAEPAGRGRHRAGRRRERAGLPRLVVGRLRVAPAERGGRLSRQFTSAGLERLLTQAALEVTPVEFCLFGMTLAVLGAGLGLVARRPPLVLLGAVGGAVLPVLWVRRRAARRLGALERQLPDALTMINGALRAGHSFLQAVDAVGTQLQPPLGPELLRVAQETRLNVPLEDALRRLAARVGSRDLDLVVAAVSVQREVGGNLAQVVDRVAETIRERLRLRGEIRTLTAQGRLSGYVVGSLPLALGVMIWWLNPGYLEVLWTSPLGRLMMAVCAVMVGVGFLLIRRLVTVDF